MMRLLITTKVRVFDAPAPVLSVTWTLNVCVPAIVGVPPIAPEALKSSPGAGVPGENE